MLDQINALNTVTSDLSSPPRRSWRIQGAEINQQAASSSIDVAKLQAAFDNVFAHDGRRRHLPAQAVTSMAETVQALEGQIQRAQPYLARLRAKRGHRGVTPPVGRPAPGRLTWLVPAQRGTPARSGADGGPDRHRPRGHPGGAGRRHRRRGRSGQRQPGDLPVAAVRGRPRVTDLLSEIVRTSELRPLDVYAAISVRATATDYLPTTVRTFAALDPDLVDVPQASGTTPTGRCSSSSPRSRVRPSRVLEATRRQGLDALMTQGSFLRTKFSGSDLDL